MPQLLPFPFISSATYVLVLLGISIWALSVLILPLFPRVQLARMIMVRL